MIMRNYDPKAFLDYSQELMMYESVGDYNSTTKKLLVFDDMIPDMGANKKIKSYSH